MHFTGREKAMTWITKGGKLKVTNTEDDLKLHPLSIFNFLNWFFNSKISTNISVADSNQLYKALQLHISNIQLIYFLLHGICLLL